MSKATKPARKAAESKPKFSVVAGGFQDNRSKETTDFILGSKPELDQLLSLVKNEKHGRGASWQTALDQCSIWGWAIDSNDVWLDVNDGYSDKLLHFTDTICALWSDLASEHGLNSRVRGVVNSKALDSAIALLRGERPVIGGQIYSSRKDRSENAPAFLKRVYADELAARSLTLSDLRGIDKSLWSGLRNWASAGKHDLDEVIPRGRSEPGPAPNRDLHFNPEILNPDDPRDALALKALKQREANRERMRRNRASVKLG